MRKSFNASSVNNRWVSGENVCFSEEQLSNGWERFPALEFGKS